MAVQPSRYEHQFFNLINGTRRWVIMFDKSDGQIDCFVVQLQFRQQTSNDKWKTFAQIDHDPNSEGGHDLYNEGLHVDIYHIDDTKSKIKPSQPSILDTPVGALLRNSQQYLIHHIDYFEQTAKNEISLTEPPKYP